MRKLMLVGLMSIGFLSGCGAGPTALVMYKEKVSYDDGNQIEDVSFKDKKAYHSIYKYESLKYDSKMFLFSNKSTLEENQISQELLFQDLSQLNFILSEFPKAEYFLKIEQGEFDITWLINNLKICSGILSCYKVEIKNEKSKYNLIFE